MTRTSLFTAFVAVASAACLASATVSFEPVGDSRALHVQGTVIAAGGESLSDFEVAGPADAGCADLDGDGTVGTADLLVILANWGACG